MGAPRQSIEDRLARYTRGAPNGCQVWTGYIDKDGYGYIFIRESGKSLNKRISRFVYERAKGPIPPGLQIDHICRNRACVNLEHLALVTLAENVRRGVSNRTLRKFVCEKCGGAYEIFRAGERRCRPCTNARQRAGYAKAHQ